MITWEELAARALARQFPDRPSPDRQQPHGLGTIAERVARTGPMQTQTARSAFLGIAARFPGTTHAEITAAYDAGDLVRGSTIRGTVHTATPAQFGALGVATRTGLRRLWTGQLGLPDELVEQLWASTEEFAADWRTVDDLRGHLVGWLAEHHPSSVSKAQEGPGRFLAFAHGGLVRRPASGTKWEGQGRPVYRAFEAPAGATMTDVVRLHLRCHGPSSRQDLAWWSGLPLREVDAALAGLDLTSHRGPMDRDYLDLPDPPAPITLEGVRLLPEFDALLCGYDSKARDRFVDPPHHARLWSQSNGLILPPLLVDGRITGFWRLTGSGRRRSLAVTWFARTRKPKRSELDEAAGALATGLGVELSEVTLTRESG